MSGIESVKNFMYRTFISDPVSMWTNKPEAEVKASDAVVVYVAAATWPVWMILGAAGCSESGNGSTEAPKPDGGASADSGCSVSTPNGPVPCSSLDGGGIINIPTGTAPTNPDAGTSGPEVRPDTTPIPPMDGGAPDQEPVTPDDGGFIPPVPIDGPVVVPPITSDASAPADTTPITPVPAKLLAFSEKSFPINFSGAGATVQTAVILDPIIFKNTSGNLNCDDPYKYFLIFWTQGDQVKDSGDKKLGDYFPNKCLNNVLNIVRQSDLGYQNETAYPFGFMFPPVDEKGINLSRPPIVLTYLKANGVTTPLIDKAFAQGVTIGDKNAACQGTDSVPAQIQIPKALYCAAGQTGWVGSLNLTTDNIKFQSDVSSAVIGLDPALAGYFRQNIWVGVVQEPVK